MNEIEGLKLEIKKQNFSQGTSGASEVSVSAGRLPPVPGVREVQLSDMGFGQQIG